MSDSSGSDGGMSDADDDIRCKEGYCRLLSGKIVKVRVKDPKPEGSEKAPSVKVEVKVKHEHHKKDDRPIGRVWQCHQAVGGLRSRGQFPFKGDWVKVAYLEGPSDCPAHERSKVWYRCKSMGVNEKASWKKNVECWNVHHESSGWFKVWPYAGPCGVMAKADEWERCIASDMTGPDMWVDEGSDCPAPKVAKKK